jgi:hypothetical protein
MLRPFSIDFGYLAPESYDHRYFPESDVFCPMKVVGIMAGFLEVTFLDLHSKPSAE